MAEAVIWDQKKQCRQQDTLTRLSGIRVNADDI